ncbi:XLF-domain-containing protein [Nemania sp. FL0916]|nr:XLF-domain-containing protein [Nemania sp. FL0916]
MELSGRWHPLPAFAGLPALLVSTRFGEASYTIYITDLASIWVEKLDRRGILLRSLQENTSIDLVDADPEQWSVFLSKLRAALDSTSSEHHLTSLGIAAESGPGSGSGSGGQTGLTLHITCELPKPLNTLKWPVRLVKCQPASLAEELVLPLIQEHHVQHSEAEDLMSQLKDKDALIKKLIDKLSTMHTPLELIFNSLSAKHPTTRAAAEERIKGLAPFDEAKWRSQRKMESPQSAPDLLRSAFGDAGLGRESSASISVPETLNDWWAKLGPGLITTSMVASQPESTSARQEPSGQGHGRIDVPDSIETGDFQVQATPTHLASRSPIRGKLPKGEVVGDSTESDESEVPDSHPKRTPDKPRSKIGLLGKTKIPNENNSTSQSSQTLHADEDDTASDSEDAGQPVLTRQTKKPNTRLGTIGKPKPSSPPIEAVAPTGSSEDANDETASGSDSDSGNAPQPQSAQKEAPITPQKRPLGRIGGKPRAPTASPRDQKQQTLDTSRDDSPSSKKTEVRKLGAIGRKPQAESKATTSNNAQEEQESETDERKAERKRAELAKELDRQQTVVPARKKRKF